MSDTEQSEKQLTDVEALLRSALRPIEPPESLPGRVEETLSAVTEAAAEELSAWAEELSDSELAALRDPRNWLRPVAAAAAGTVAGGALLLIEVQRRRKRPSGVSGGVSALTDQLRSRIN
jgi:hypothetical protein